MPQVRAITKSATVVPATPHPYHIRMWATPPEGDFTPTAAALITQHIPT